MQHRITEKGWLLKKDGSLSRKGYSVKPLLKYNPKSVKLYPLRFLNRMRIKEWDYYGVTTDKNFLAVCVANIGYIGLVFAYLIDFETGEIIEKILPTPLGAGCNLPESSTEGDVTFKGLGVSLEFKRFPERRDINLYWKRFHKGDNLKVQLSLSQPYDMESMIIATPISKNRFYYNQKVNCMTTAGEIHLGNNSYFLTKDSAMATLDWGRGVWEYSTFWNWASASGFLENGQTIGLNLGQGFGDLSRATENCFYINGKMVKLGKLALSYDAKDYMKPWRFSTDDGYLDLVFRPFVEKVSKTNLLLAKMEGHQMFGNYSGQLKTPEGDSYNIVNLVGWAEEHKSRW